MTFNGMCNYAKIILIVATPFLFVGGCQNEEFAQISKQPDPTNGQNSTETGDTIGTLQMEIESAIQLFLQKNEDDVRMYVPYLYENKRHNEDVLMQSNAISFSLNRWNAYIDKDIIFARFVKEYRRSILEEGVRETLYIQFKKNNNGLDVVNWDFVEHQLAAALVRSAKNDGEEAETGEK